MITLFPFDFKTYEILGIVEDLQLLLWKYSL